MSQRTAIYVVAERLEYEQASNRHGIAIRSDTLNRKPSDQGY